MIAAAAAWLAASAATTWVWHRISVVLADRPGRWLGVEPDARATRLVVIDDRERRARLTLAHPDPQRTTHA